MPTTLIYPNPKHGVGMPTTPSYMTSNSLEYSGLSGPVKFRAFCNAAATALRVRFFLL